MHINKNRNKIQIINNQTLNINGFYEPKIYKTLNNLYTDKTFKNLNPKNNFFSSFKVPKEIYENSLIEINKLILSFDSDLLLDIISIDKLINIQKVCLETFNYIIFLDKNFNWLNFKKKINDILYLKNKMKQIDYNKININSLNFFLNRLAPMNQFPRLIPFSTGLNHILKFIKNQINVIGYLNQKKDKLNNIKFKNEVIKSNITNSLNKIIPSETESINSNILLNKSKKIFIKSNNITKSISSEFSLRKRKTNKNIFQNSNKTKLNVLTLNDYNAYADKIKSEKKNLEKLPLINNKTFEEMRKFFGMNKTNNKKFEIKNLNIIKKFQNSNKSNLLIMKNKK
jgi:hypothetical protein